MIEQQSLFPELNEPDAVPIDTEAAARHIAEHAPADPYASHELRHMKVREIEARRAARLGEVASQGEKPPLPAELRERIDAHRANGGTPSRTNDGITATYVRNRVGVLGNR